MIPPPRSTPGETRRLRKHYGGDGGWYSWGATLDYFVRRYEAEDGYARAYEMWELCKQPFGEKSRREHEQRQASRQTQRREERPSHRPSTTPKGAMGDNRGRVDRSRDDYPRWRDQLQAFVDQNNIDQRCRESILDEPTGAQRELIAFGRFYDVERPSAALWARHLDLKQGRKMVLDKYRYPGCPWCGIANETTDEDCRGCDRRLHTRARSIPSHRESRGSRRY